MALHSMKPGTRVGALESIKDKEIRFYGYGVYVGEETPKGFPISNPKIKLDNGKEVWGYMCWWSTEDAVKKNIDACLAQGYKFTQVDPPLDGADESEEFAQA